jgi:two-component system cell cycle response regulator
MAEKFFGNGIMNKAQTIFFREIEQRLPQSQKALSTLEANGFDREACETLYKFAHTLKGSGQMVELWDIANPAFEMTTALLLIKDYQVELNQGILRFLKERMAEILQELTDFHSQNGETPENSKNENKQILVIDDDPTVTELIKENLKLYGFSVSICYDIDSAERFLQLEHPDLIILDILFPTGDGIDFCRKIRSNMQWQIVPVIFLTVKDKLQDKLAGFSTGADDYLCKPFKIEELVARIQAILNRVANSRELVLQDELTKVYNRRYLQIRLSEEIVRAQRANLNFSVAMIDLDYFKKINDRYGHIVGDETLQCLVDKIVGNLRGSDVVCRYGGEEFVIIMPETSQLEAGKVLNRLQQLIAAEPLRLPKNKIEISLSISIGVAVYPRNGVTEEELLKSADIALYKAKNAGRNLVMFFAELES